MAWDVTVPDTYAESHIGSTATKPGAAAHKTAQITHTHPFNGPFSGSTQVSRYQKGKTNLDFTEARDSEWQWKALCCLKHVF